MNWENLIFHNKDVQYYNVQYTIWTNPQLIMELSVIIASQWVAQS
jgi:hypothetical protein